MYQEINVYQFRDQFQDIRPDNFSYDGLTALYDYFEDLADDIGEMIEFDPIAICYEYSEYDSLKEYNDSVQPDKEFKSLDDLRNETIVISIPDSDGFIVLDY